MNNQAEVLDPMNLTADQVRAKLERLVMLSQHTKVGPDAQSNRMEAMKIGIELGTAVICSFIRVAQAQERMAAILEAEHGPVGSPPLFRGK